MTRMILAATASLALAACGGGNGQNPIYGANSAVNAANSLVNALSNTAGTIGRARTQYGYGYGFPWGQQYQQPYQQRSLSQ